MRPLLLSVVCLIALTGWSQARLGETVSECVERYGPVIETRHAELPQSDAEVAVFSKSAVTIYVEFKGGKAWHITFRKPVLTLTEMEALLKANSGDGDWSSPLAVAGRTFRLSMDQQRLSVLNEPRPSTGTVLEVMSREYIDQYRANMVERLRKPGAVEDMKRKINPLPGF